MARASIRLPRINGKVWRKRSDTLAKKLGVTCSDVFWGVRFYEDREYFEPRIAAYLAKRYRKVFAWCAKIHAEVRHA